MKAKVLAGILERAESWPESAQRELAEVALEIEQSLTGEYQATPEELKAIDEGLAAAERGELASDAEVEAVFAKYRNR